MDAAYDDVSEPIPGRGLAVASLILGLVGPCTVGLTSVIGLILGIVALGRIPPGRPGRGWAIGGLVVSGAGLLLCILAVPLVLVGLVTFRNSAGPAFPPTAVPASPPAEWSINATRDGRTYQLTSTRSTWTEAASEAARVGGHLVTIARAEEETWLLETFGVATQGESNPALWIGLTNRTTEGAWTWTSGAPVTYTNWMPGEPNNLGDEDVAILTPRGWNDTQDGNWEQPHYGIIELPAGLAGP